MLTASFYALWSLLALLRNCPLISQFTNSTLDCHVTACRQKTCGSYSNISSPIFKPVCAAFNYWAFYLIIFIYSTHHKLSFFLQHSSFSFFLFFCHSQKDNTSLFSWDESLLLSFKQSHACHLQWEYMESGREVTSLQLTLQTLHNVAAVV